MTNAPILHFDEGREDGVRIDLPKLVASRMLIQANSGGGKSWAIRYLLEQTHGQVQQLVLDSEGEFASLREEFPYVLAGKSGDLPATTQSAKLLARRLVELGASAVVDIYDLSLSDRKRFVRLFLEELMHLPRSLWRPLLVVIDEAHRYVPETGSSEAADAVTTLCTQGRKRGFAACLATQRLSKLSKDAAAELLNKLIGRTHLDVDVRRAGDDLGFSKDERQKLKRLRPGEFYVYGPAIGREVTLVRTGDVATTHPEPGKIAPAPPPPPEKVRKLIDQLEDLEAEAEEEERTLEALEENVARLEEELADTQKALAAARDVAAEAYEEAHDDCWTTEELERSRQEAKEEAWYDAIDALTDAVAEVTDGLTARIADAIHEECPPLSSRNGRPGVLQNPDQDSVTPKSDRRRADSRGLSGQTAYVQSHPEQTLRSPPTATESISGPQQRILNAVATLERLGERSPPPEQVAAFAGYKPGGHFNNVKASLRSEGLIEYPPGGGGVVLTADGRALAEPARVRSLDEAHRLWLSLASGPQRKLLAVVIDAYPHAPTVEELAERSGYSVGGHFNNVKGSLRTWGAIEYPEPGHVIASELLFPAILR